MYELKKNWKNYLRVNLLGPGPRLIKKRVYRAAVSQRLRNTVLEQLVRMVTTWFRTWVFGLFAAKGRTRCELVRGLHVGK